MFNITNKSPRLVTTHLGDMLPPGVAVAVSEVTMEHPTMQQWSSEGLIEVVEIVDPPPITRRAFSNPAAVEPKEELPPEAHQPTDNFYTGDIEQPQDTSRLPRI